MRNKIIFAILALTLPLVCFGKEIKYKVVDIPKELKENARSVVRNEEMVFEIKSTNSATLKVTKAVTILNKNGVNDSYFIQSYDKFNRISSISGRVYNENGELVKRLGGEDIIDHSAISGFSIYEDNRVKYIDPKNLTIPFTVEYTYTVDFIGLFHYPAFDPLSYNISVEKSSYKVISPKSLNFRYLEMNIPVKAQISSEKENNIYLWELSNLKALVYEPFSHNYQDFFPMVIAAPNDFEIDNYKGNLSSWKSFGEWITRLNENKNILPEETKKKLIELTYGERTDYDKVKRVYEYMQNKVRYVSIQIGIGGWQPFEASTVDKLSYGDCKALANYMKSMLDVIGVKSHYCLVNAGENAHGMIKEFPSTQFNHAFLCVPQKDADTIWIECTSQRLPCGYISDFTDDRDVLLIDNENSKVVHTKAYTGKENQEIRKITVKLEGAGSGTAKVNALYKGQNYDQILPIYVTDDVNRKRMISNRISNLANFQLKNFSYKENREIIPSFEESLSIDFEGYGTQMPPRMFFPSNFLNRLATLPERVRNRKTDVYIRRPKVEIDTVVYELSEFYKIESVPAPIAIESQFGSYRANSNVKDSKIVYDRYFELKSGKYPPSSYAEFLEFLEKVSAADRAQCSLIRK
jgi:hypothetical protein